MQDGNKLKEFHSSNDLVFLQINFQIYVVGFIDCQEAYHIYNRQHEQIGFDKMVHDLIGDGVHVDKTAQRADWLIRPLPKDMLLYAANDTKYLFDCWLKLKEQCAFLEHESFHRSKRASLITPSSQRKQTAMEAWQSNMDTKTEDEIEIFSIRGLQNLFQDLFMWRDSVAKQADLHPHKILRPRELEFLTRSMPQNAYMCSRLFPTNKFLRYEWKQQIVGIIDSHRANMYDDITPLFRKGTRFTKCSEMPASELAAESYQREVGEEEVDLAQLTFSIDNQSKETSPDAATNTKKMETETFIESE